MPGATNLKCVAWGHLFEVCGMGPFTYQVCGLGPSKRDLKKLLVILIRMDPGHTFWN